MADRRGNSVERYYAAKRKRRKAKKRRIYFTLSLFCILTFVVLSLTVFFNIRSFRVQGNTSYSTEQIIAATGLKEGDNLFRLNKFKIADSMLEKLPYLGSVEIYRKLPTTLCIDVQETKARLVAYSGGKYVLMDEHLKVLEIKEELPEGLTYLVGLTLIEPTVGKTAAAEKENHTVLLDTLIDALYERFDPEKISAIDLTEVYSLRVYYDQHRVKILLGNSDQLNDKLQMAQNAIEQNGISEKARIDITNPGAAYYRVLEEEETDDLVGMLQGTATAKEEKAYEAPDTSDESEQSSADEEENNSSDEQNG